MANVTHIRLGFWGPEVDTPLHSLITQLINQYSFFAATILGVAIAFFTLYPAGHHRRYAPPDLLVFRCWGIYYKFLANSNSLSLQNGVSSMVCDNLMLARLVLITAIISPFRPHILSGSTRETYRSVE